jgi:DNA-binding CsgD family transcriptional regulator
MKWSDMNARERVLIGALMDALIHVKTEPELVCCLEEFVSKLISADCMALCMSRPGQPARFDFLATKLPTEFFARSAEWEGHDFVRGAVSEAPGTVLCDTDMISREDLESNAMYRLSHDLGTPFEQVIAVLLPEPELPGHIGFTGYRLRPRPFSERDRKLVQHVSRLFTDTVRKSRLLQERELNDRLLDTLAQDLNVALLVLAPPADIIKRTSQLPALVKKWFTTEECDPSGVPLELIAKLASLTSSAGARMGMWEREGTEETLRVTFTPVAGEEVPTHWQLRFEEAAHPLRASWVKPLTRKEKQIAHLLLQGKSDKEIAQLAGCEPSTVKVHLRNIYNKSETRGRSAIIARALKNQKF